MWVRAAADLILPRRCIVCDRKLNLNERHLCLGCLADIPLTRFWIIRHNPMADRFNEIIQKNQGTAGSPRERYAFAAALFFYDSEASYRKIPYRIKYHGDLAAGRHFGKMLGEHLSRCPWMQDADAVIPVPLHWSRRWKRGYNQAEVIAREVAAAMKLPVYVDILKRNRATKTQTRLNTEEKVRNVQDAFKASYKDVGQFRHIILIDDVFTTGSTLFACFRALRAVFPPGVRISVATLGFVGGA